MASIECPACGHEVCLDDATFRVILESHAPLCPTRQEGEDKKKWEIYKAFMTKLYRGDPK